MPKILTNKESLIKTSLNVFLKNGYYHTSFSVLAKACQIEKPHFYYYFKNKKDLMKEVLLYAYQYIENRVFNIAYQEDKSADEKLSKMLNSIPPLYSNHEYGCFMGNTLLEISGKEPIFEAILLDYFKAFESALQHIYIEKITQEDAEKLATQTIANLQGSIMLMKLYRDKTILKNAIRQIVTEF